MAARKGRRCRLTIVEFQRRASRRGRCRRIIGTRGHCRGQSCGEKAGVGGLTRGRSSGVETVKRLEVSRFCQKFEANGGRSLPFGSAVLVPRFDLSISQIEFGGQFLTVLDAQVLLLLEAALQRLQLIIGKGRAGLSLLPNVVVHGPGGRRRSRSPTRRRGIFVVVFIYRENVTF